MEVIKCSRLRTVRDSATGPRPFDSPTANYSTWHYLINMLKGVGTHAAMLILLIVVTFSDLSGKR